LNWFPRDISHHNDQKLTWQAFRQRGVPTPTIEQKTYVR
jgi:hypothetical protein